MKFINMTMHGWKGCFDYQRCSCVCGLLHEQQESRDMKSIPIRYCFTFQDKTQEIINLRLNPKTLELLNDPPGYLPS